jgi:hypothetical protein
MWTSVVGSWFRASQSKVSCTANSGLVVSMAMWCLVSYINNYTKVSINRQAKVSYITYNWSLNEGR